jgi:mRNA-degrading endonuclease toxin of MazEF toxin-antitoxin module
MAIHLGKCSAIRSCQRKGHQKLGDEDPARRGPTALEIPKGAGGLRKTRVALCHQVTTLDRAKLSKRIGTLPPAVLSAVNEGLKAVLDLLE